MQETPDHPAGQPCPAVALVPPGLQSAVLHAHPTVDLRLLAVYLTCALDQHDQGDHHAVLYDHFPSPGAGALWTRWPNGQLPSTFALHPDCTTHSHQGTACAHFLNHPGPHSWSPAARQDGART